MSKEQNKNYGKSVRAKLLNVARKKEVFNQTILTRYFQERLLYRISQTHFRDNFYLKGGALMYIFSALSAYSCFITELMRLLGTSLRVQITMISRCSGIAAGGAARTLSEGLRRSTVAHFARKVRGDEYCGGQTRLKIQQGHASERWPYSLRVRGPHFASKVSYNAGAAANDYAGQHKSPLRGRCCP